ncbi:MAG: helix-turn-helix transcriptional regulator [Acidipropionibacterium sp.]|jgi:DNA-binding CsgD family transcriptional regulator|nr:helix-turn-helix transcriptional regulator [Acidipropionibacterium sp.]
MDFRPQAPETWASRVPWLEAALMAALAAAMLLALICVLVRAFRAHVTERRHLANCVATTSMGAGLMVMCVALAALRDPGEIDPSTGSVGYIVAIAMVAVLATYGNAASPWPLRVVIGYWMAAFALLIGVYAAAVGPAAVGVAITVAITAAAAAATVWVVRWLERRLVVEKPRSVTSIPGLSPREQEVLAGVAAGATNAGIAADLFLSERTVEQHVRSIFAKLDLGDRDSSNHRVRAAVLWWQQQSFSGDVGEQ